MKTDSLFYRLFQRNPKIALELLGLDYRGESYRFGSEEIKQTGFRLDGIFTPIDEQAKQPLIFAEVQYQPDEDFYARFFTEITLYLRLHKTVSAWIALVIYPTRGIEKIPQSGFSPFMNLPQLQRIYLEDYRHQHGLTLNLELIRLIASHPKQTAAVVQNLVKQHKIDSDTLDFIETILVYKLPRLTREEIKTMLNVQNIELKQTRFYQEVWGEGHQEGEQTLLQRLLSRRFGALPDWVQQRLLHADSAQLEQWADKFLDAQTLEAIFEDVLH